MSRGQGKYVEERSHQQHVEWMDDFPEDVRSSAEPARTDRIRETETGFGALVGKSARMRELYRVLAQAGPSSASVLILGESGTGKELVARTLHELSPRSDKPFIAINCAAIPETLLESELFGHEKGAFTGAAVRRCGYFELANGGTLFLDEMSAMPPVCQVKLLRVLEENNIRRLGGQEDIPVDVRLITAMNQNPEMALEEGKLRLDLYYRLNVFTLKLPPLRERLEDLPLLVDHFIPEFNRANGQSVKGIGPDALRALLDYSWPGNVRELRNVIERAVILARSEHIDLDGLPPSIVSSIGDSPSSGSSEPRMSENHLVLKVGTTIEDAVRNLMIRTLEDVGYNKTRAAKILGVSTKTIYNKLHEWSIHEPMTAKKA